MFSAHPGMRAAVVAILGSLLSCSTVLPQTTNSVPRDSVPIFLLRSAAKAVAPNCSNGTADTSVPPLEVVSTTPDVPASDVPAPCVMPAPVRSETEINSCQHAVISAATCKNYEELLQADLMAMGKNGQKVARARERILEILSEPNSCADWYRTKDSNPAETFRTLNFEIDRKGTNYISEVRVNSSSFVLFNPYVARVIQEGGEYQTITLNAEGAFFQPQATLVEQAKSGGPVLLHGSHILGVGPYLGGTSQAQITTLLHELGHLIGLLPPDEGDVNGKSVQNTQEMLRYCRAQVELPFKKSALSASR